MGTWHTLQQELDQWMENDLCATLWWRDDDAFQPTSELDRLCRIAVDAVTPIALAVPPAISVKQLVTGLGDAQSVYTILQHGYAHINHEPPGQKKSEIGTQRPVATILSELSAGQTKLERLFGRRFLRVLVPPWNRIDIAAVAELHRLNFIGISTFGPRKHKTVEQLTQCNAHVDIIDWRGTRGFAGITKVLGQLITHLQQRRTGRADQSEPTGLLTHHLAHDESCWRFIQELIEFTADHSAVRWLNSAELFG